MKNGKRRVKTNIMKLSDQSIHEGIMKRIDGVNKGIKVQLWRMKGGENGQGR